MPLEFRPWITRRDLQAEPETLFLFGDDEARKGSSGQAFECRGEPTAVGVATKRAPCMRPDCFWSDADFDRVTKIIDADLSRAFAHVANGGLVVCPSNGLGTLRAELPTRAPRVFQYLRQRIVELKRLGRPR